MIPGEYIEPNLPEMSNHNINSVSRDKCAEAALNRSINWNRSSIKSHSLKDKAMKKLSHT